MKPAVVFLFCLLALTAKTQLPGSDVDARYSHLEKEGVNMSQKLAYTYFFYSDDMDALKDFYKTRLKNVYDLVKIDFKQGDGYLMEVRETEKHSRISLKKRIGMLAEQSAKTKKVKFNSWNVNGKDGKSLYKD